ncbi:MAG: Arm DNA-binding domain-containing protein [Chitinophagaceae bacterium]
MSYLRFALYLDNPILFFTRIASKRRGNQYPIYLRITVNGQRMEQSTHRFVQRSQWSATAGRMKGGHAAARALNSFLDALRNKVHATEREMVQDGKEIRYEWVHLKLSLSV